MPRAHLVAALWLLGFALPSPAAAEIELRTGASLDVRLATPLSLSVKEELRVDMRPGEPRSWLQSVVLKIRPVKWLRIEPQYRLARHMQSSVEARQVRHRLGLAVRLRLPLGPVRLGLRARYQVRLSEGETPRQQLVTKVAARLRRKGLPVAVSAWLELFLRLPEEDDPVLADKVRLGAAVVLPAGLCDLAIEIQLEKSLKNKHAPPLPILAMKFEFELDARRSMSDGRE